MVDSNLHTWCRRQPTSPVPTVTFIASFSMKGHFPWDYIIHLCFPTIQKARSEGPVPQKLRDRQIASWKWWIWVGNPDLQANQSNLHFPEAIFSAPKKLTTPPEKTTALYRSTNPYTETRKKHNKQHRNGKSTMFFGFSWPHSDSWCFFGAFPSFKIFSLLIPKAGAENFEVINPKETFANKVSVPNNNITKKRWSKPTFWSPKQGEGQKSSKKATVSQQTLSF